MNVLVVKDDPFIRDMAVTELEEAGHKVMEAASCGGLLGSCRTFFADESGLWRVPGKRMRPRSQWALKVRPVGAYLVPL